MGGSIGVTIREEDGTEHRMCRWTNSLPGFIHNLKFINKDKDYLKDYLKVWYDMREDYLENKDNKDLKFKSEPLEIIDGRSIGGGKPQKFRFNMTEVYASDPYLAPMGYGLVVIDMQNNVIFHCQGYCGIGKTHMPIGMTSFDEFKEFEELVNSGRITKILDMFNKEKEIKQVKLQLKDGEVTDMLRPSERYYYNFYLNMSPFKVRKFDETPKGIKELKKEVLNLGFKLTKEEDEMWEEYIKEQEE